eukprot:356042-Chlamydomonas_euryale.AAC.2
MRSREGDPSQTSPRARPPAHVQPLQNILHTRASPQTRSGDLVRLVELLDEAKARCVAQITQRAADAGEAVSADELDAAAAAMGYGAVSCLLFAMRGAVAACGLPVMGGGGGRGVWSGGLFAMCGAAAACGSPVMGGASIS